ncbi:MAG: HAMP domain-containing sensor histidine kinase, partial [bacterium]
EGYYKFAKYDKMHEGFFDANLITKAGEKKPFNFSLTPIIDNDIITGFISIVRDISDRKEMERMLIQSNAELEYKIKERTLELQKLNEELVKDIDKRKKIEAILFDQTNELKLSNETKDRLFSIIAHDLRNPFTTLIGASAFLSKEFDDLPETEKKKLISGIHSSSIKIYDLLENLLEWSRIQTGKSEYQPEWFYAHESGNLVISLLNETALKKRITISNIIPQDLKVFADKNMIGVVLRNLVMNAVKFSHPEGVIELSAAQLESSFEIKVKDNGMGIDEDKIPNLFSSGYVSKGTANESGTGLGLRICKEFIEKNGGSIRVDSAKGIGSNFIISLPRRNE